jgi:hypothetical protein
MKALPGVVADQEPNNPVAQAALAVEEEHGNA